ncbi:ATP-binding protein [Actinacidiphila rubida]|uniref:Histidine kinase-like ATPase domain-containing protein n=1 Tax=Actinacidiphila rubida TaxID=310780 RepID=A0A1H8U8Y3_9ACTN|nr:ATP-binding protein [Actinacidiphila rubida]SEO99118.1 Histidine kinase-like ATPase domain-containing protein [Actinacidiphila rubida]
MTASTTRQLPEIEREFTQRFSSTRLGARLARHLALYHLHRWGHPPQSGLAEAAGLIVAELASNAVTHGRVPGRDFELRLTLTARMLRIDVTDTRTERRPPEPGQGAAPDPLAESGRGLMLVEALAERWSVIDGVPIGKTVRAELAVPRKPS